jgi:hypothetical protein
MFRSEKGDRLSCAITPSDGVPAVGAMPKSFRVSVISHDRLLELRVVRLISVVLRSDPLSPSQSPTVRSHDGSIAILRV